MRTDYASRLSISLVGDDTTRFHTISGRLLATGYSRVVVGDRGPYVEFDARHLQVDALEATDVPHTYYVELRSVVDHVKVYAQLLSVGYADYVPGMFYVSPFQLHGPDGRPLIVPIRKVKVHDGQGMLMS